MRPLLCLLIFTTTLASAQNVQKEINDQVWKPFIKSFSEYDTETFMSVHSKDVIRAGRDGKQVLNWDQYYAQTNAGNERGKKDKSTLNIELRFTERINSANQAMDVGVYKTTWASAGGKSETGYGRFHVALRKENGVWKILVDTDSSEGRTIGEAQFLAAKPME